MPHELSFPMSWKSPSITLLYLLKLQHLEYSVNENKLPSLFRFRNLLHIISLVSKKHRASFLNLRSAQNFLPLMWAYLSRVVHRDY